ncbi:hypothetical protein MBLNU230_g6759t1 [Neophaeotheca triangularis]
METSDLTSQISSLQTTITSLTTTLTPLLDQPLTTTTSTLPLLDKAKLYILATYTLESLLFSSLKLSAASGQSGIEDVKEHAVFAELKRVREYFGKVESVEASSSGMPEGNRVDKAAVGRLVKAGVYNREDGKGGKREGGEAVESEGLVPTGKGITEEVRGNKKRKRDGKWEKANSGAGAKGEEGVEGDRYGTARRFEVKGGGGGAEGREELVKPSALAGEGEGSTAERSLPKRNKGPKSNHEAFEALLQGPLPKEDKEEKKSSKKKRKSRGEMQRQAEDERAREMK